jgi:hypothetical protein
METKICSLIEICGEIIWAVYPLFEVFDPFLVLRNNYINFCHLCNWSHG